MYQEGKQKKKQKNLKNGNARPYKGEGMGLFL